MLDALHAAWKRLRRSFRLSLTARFGLIALVSTILLIIAGMAAHGFFSNRLMRLLIDPEIESVIDNLASNAEPGLEGIVLRDLPFDPRYVRPTSGRYFQIARINENDTLDIQIASRSLFDVTIDLAPLQVRELLESTPNARGVRFLNAPKGPDLAPLRIGARILQIPDLEGRYLVLVAVAPEEIIRPAANLLATAFAVFVGFCALMVIAITVLQMGVGLEPLRRLRRDIAEVRRGNADRLGREYAAELQPLAGELNALLDHNREVVERARRHVGNLAHALKTPIAVLKNAAGEQADGDMVKQSVEEMEAFVERQLRRARVAARAESQAGAHAPTVGYRTPVVQNLNDLIFMMEQKYDHVKAIDIELVSEGDVTFRGEREDLLEMVANLLDNACKYGRSRVVVSLATPGANQLEIAVEDDGPGLTGDDIARVMTRGARLDEAAPGQGLGLSILTETVQLYAGELTFERSDLGGLKARLRLPATD
ncbi:MAG: sensor histidine kinase [Caulobacterales bacterium]